MGCSPSPTLGACHPSSRWRQLQHLSPAPCCVLHPSSCRRWAQLAQHFGPLWEMSLRALDDIKETVRQAALTLARSVRGLTLRLVDVQQSGAAGGCTTAGRGRGVLGCSDHPCLCAGAVASGMGLSVTGWRLGPRGCCSAACWGRRRRRCCPRPLALLPRLQRAPPAPRPCADAREAVAVLLPLLLERGIPSGVAEVRGLAVGTLTAAVKAAGAAQVGLGPEPWASVRAPRLRQGSAALFRCLLCC